MEKQIPIDQRLIRSWTRWTQEEDAELFRLIKTGYYMHEIADQMEGRTDRSISNRVYNKKFLCNAYKEAGAKRSYRGRRARMTAVMPAPDPIVSTPEMPKVDLGPVTRAATAGAIFSIATFVLVLGALLS
tara:strand:+ start:813 stop:1202 length:390 start_codon:yes stop_codon:yes gene_type:complete